MSKKTNNIFLVYKPIVFVERQFYKAQFRYRFNRVIFILFNLLSMLITFTILTIGTLVLAKVIWSYASPNYFYTTTVVTAILTLVTSLINFFYIKDNIQKYKSQKDFIHSEIMKYDTNSEEYANSKDKKFEIFHRVTLHMGYESSREANNGRS